LRTILLTNDDGVTRPGLWALYEELTRLGEVVVVAPESARSATGMSITLHKPLRVKKILVRGRRAYSCSGTPSDCVIIALRTILKNTRPALVVSGINEGNNVSLQAVYGSGTVAAAVRAALMGIPAAAFSLAFRENTPVNTSWLRRAMPIAAKRSAEIVERLLEMNLPRGVDYLNVNFPPDVGPDTPVKITRAARTRYEEVVEERRDPRFKKYYWLHGRLHELEPGTDAYEVLAAGNISITPMKVDASVTDPVASEILARVFAAVQE
jgi:5'-nucleotidase